MNAHEELVLRLATKRRARLGLSDAAYAELVEAVRKDPQGFVDDGEEEAFSLVASALDRYENDREGDDLLDDDAFAAARGRRMARMRSDCAEALSHDPGCVDALLMDAIATDAGSDALVGALMDIERRFAERRPASRGGDPQDAWEDVFAHPYLRLAASLARLPRLSPLPHVRTGRLAADGRSAERRPGGTAWLCPGLRTP